MRSVMQAIEVREMLRWIKLALQRRSEGGQRILDQRALPILDHLARQTQRRQHPGADRLRADQHHVDALALAIALDPGEIPRIFARAFPFDNAFRNRQTHQAATLAAMPSRRSSAMVMATSSGTLAATSGDSSIPSDIDTGCMPTMAIAFGARSVNCRLASTSDRLTWCGDSLVLKKTGTSSPFNKTGVAGGWLQRTQSTTIRPSRFSSCSSISMPQVPPSMTSTSGGRT